MGGSYLPPDAFAPAVASAAAAAAGSRVSVPGAAAPASGFSDTAAVLRLLRDAAWPLPAVGGLAGAEAAAVRRRLRVLFAEEVVRAVKRCAAAAMLAPPLPPVRPLRAGAAGAAGAGSVAASAPESASFRVLPVAWAALLREFADVFGSEAAAPAGAATSAGAAAPAVAALAGGVGLRGGRAEAGALLRLREELIGVPASTSRPQFLSPGPGAGRFPGRDQWGL